MCDILEERKEAMLMYYVLYLSKAEICRRLKRSRPWLDRWLGRYNPGDQGRIIDAKKETALSN